MKQEHRRTLAQGQEDTSTTATHSEVSAVSCVLDQHAPVRRLADAIGDKWGLLCLYALEDGPMRFNALERRLPGISQKVLTETLRKLERVGLVHRTVHAEVPPRVEYRLTALGGSLTPITAAMCEWSAHHGAMLR